MRISLIGLLVTLMGCASNDPGPIDYEELASMITVTKQEYITLHTGQVCEIKDMKIIACEDIEAATGEE